MTGTVSRDFWLLFFSWISSPQAPECTIRAVSIFFENSRIYSQLKVHHRCPWHWWKVEKIANGVVDSSGKFACLRYQFAPGINSTSETGGKIWHRCRWHWWCSLTCEYLREFAKKFETVLTGYPWAGGNWFMKKTRSKKSRDTVPLKAPSARLDLHESCTLDRPIG
jgi:hypothetical protein